MIKCKNYRTVTFTILNCKEKDWGEWNKQNNCSLPANV